MTLNDVWDVINDRKLQMCPSYDKFQVYPITIKYVAF